MLFMLLWAAGVFFANPPQQNAGPLHLVQTIPMPEVKGRIDHMALDAARRRLFVAALGNNSLEVVDLRAGRRVQSIGMLQEPQGVVFVTAMDRLFVTTGGDGKIHAFAGEPLREISEAAVGEDADNLRYDAAAGKLYVAYGEGAVGAVDPSTLKLLGSIRLPAHPESFQLEPSGARMYVNVPNARQVAMLDLVKRANLASWPLEKAQANYPMALIPGGRRLLIATRRPPRLLVLDTESGKVVAAVECAGDADDLFYDETRKLVYISCGDGVIDVFRAAGADRYQEVARIPGAPGARTALWTPELNRLFLAVPGRPNQESAILVYSPDR